MSGNPYSAQINRYFQIIVGGLVSLLSAGIIVRSFITGLAPRIGLRSQIAGNPYTLADNPSQFWFAIFVHSLVCAFFAWWAWRSYLGLRT